MVSAVFHSPLDTTPVPLQSKKVERAATAPVPSAQGEAIRPASAPAARVPFDWRGFWLKVLPPVVGVALLVGIWELLTLKSSSFPTPGATFDAA
ncbi:MAG TPA: nitrate ABC transporter, permease protein, partial [Burkholderiaceae bacterium]|nr:nitrate ABC transporter, permease protein [Burkholderiaceae bacterium]